MRAGEGLVMRSLGRAAAAFAALLLALAPAPSFAQLPGTPVAYGEEADTFGHCTSSPTGNFMPYGSVENDRCTVTLPTEDEAGGQVDFIAASLYQLELANNPEQTLTIPVELIFDGTVTTDTRFNIDYQPPQTGFPQRDSLISPFALRGFLSVLHGPRATEDAPLTLTVTEDSEIASSMSQGLMAIDVRVESDADATVDNRGVLLPQVLPGIRMLATEGSDSDLTVRNSGVIAGQRDSTNPDEFQPGLLYGILVQSWGTGDITVENTGLIRVTKQVHPRNVIRQAFGIRVTSARSSGDIRITAGGVIEANHGIRLDLVNAAPVWVQVAEEGRVDAHLYGISITYNPAAPSAGDPRSTCFLPSGPLYRSCVSVFGTVEADGGQVQTQEDAGDPLLPVPSAAVVIQGGGVLAIGPGGRVAHRTEGQNAVVRFEGDDPAAIVYLAQGARVAGMRGSDDGILGAVEAPESTAYQALVLPDDIAPAELMDAIEAFHRGDMSQEDLGTLLARVQVFNLRQENVIVEDFIHDIVLPYDFETHRFDSIREVGPRGRVYEALPSVLLSVNRPLSHDDRWSAPRADGWWMWAEAAGGDWEADASGAGEGTFADGEYDYDRYAVEIGRDWAPSENAVLGLAAHYRNIDADVGDSGNIDAYGYGIGVSARVNGEKAYLAVQGSATWYEVDLSSSRRGVLRENLDGFGWSAGAELGYRLEYNEFAVTPRVGATYSEVDVDSFQGPGARVSLEDGESVLGRAGVRVQRGGLYAAVDVEHEFSDDERRVETTGMEAGEEVMAVLESKAEDTWVRATAGGIHEWGEGRYSLHARFRYAESAGDNDEFSGSLTLQGRF